MSTTKQNSAVYISESNRTYTNGNGRDHRVPSFGHTYEDDTPFDINSYAKIMREHTLRQMNIARRTSRSRRGDEGNIAPLGTETTSGWELSLALRKKRVKELRAQMYPQHDDEDVIQQQMDRSLKREEFEELGSIRKRTRTWASKRRLGRHSIFLGAGALDTCIFLTAVLDGSIVTRSKWTVYHISNV